MPGEKQEVQKTAEKETAPVSSTENKQQGLKILGNKQPIDNPEDSKEWKEQPAVATLDKGVKDVEPEKEPEGQETDAIVLARQKELDRVKAKREAILVEIAKEKVETRKLKQPQPDEEEEIEQEPEEEEGWKRVENITESIVEKKVREVAEKSEFYAGKEIYKGEEGWKNQQLIEQYCKAHFKNTNNQSRAMAHQFIFGEFESESAIRSAKVEGTKKAVAASLAALGTPSGKSTIEKPAEPRKRILPRKENPDKWY